MLNFPTYFCCVEVLIISEYEGYINPRTSLIGSHIYNIYKINEYINL